MHISMIFSFLFFGGCFNLLFSLNFYRNSCKFTNLAQFEAQTRLPEESDPFNLIDEKEGKHRQMKERSNQTLGRIRFSEYRPGTLKL